MTYTMKLARRIALSHLRLSLPVFLILASACGDPTLTEGLAPDPTDVVEISIAPKLDTIRTTDSIKLHAKGVTVAGDTVSADADVDWFASGGTITSSGTFTSTTTGQFTLLARHKRHKSVVDTASIVVIPGVATVSAVVISPASATLGTGGIRTFSASASMSDGGTAPVAVTWTATGGSISTSGSYTAGGSAGTFRVIARETSGTHADTATVTITAPTLAMVIVSPGTASLPAGATQQFTAAGQMSDGSATAVTVNWTATGGIITSAGLYTAGTTSGNFRVIGTQAGGTLADTALIGIAVSAPTLQQVILTPATTSLLTGASQQFAVSGLYSDGTSKSVAVTYTATGGTITSAGRYTAGSTAGSYRVIATQSGGTLADTSTVTVTAPTLQQVVLTPASVTLLSGTIQQFSASGRLSDGSVSSVTVTYSATGGSISAGGLYTAGATAGTFRVIATQSGGTLADTSAVTITAATLTQVIILPPTVSVAAGATQQFTVSGLLSNGATTTPAVTYSATGGTITTGGLYTAGSTAGAFRVIAVQQGGTLADTATVTVTSGVVTLTGINLSPTATTVAPSATAQFSVTGTMSDGSTSSPSVTYAATGGTISATGLYTAGATTGSFRVIATQVGGTLADTAAVTVAQQDPNEPTFRSGTDQALWSDNFDRYYSTQDMQWNISQCGATLPDGHPATNYGKHSQPNANNACSTVGSQFSLIPGRGGSGQALRGAIHADPGGSQQSVTWLSPWAPNGLSYSGRAVVIQFWFRASAGGTPGTAGTKWIEAWFTSGAAGRIQFGMDRGSSARPLWAAVLGSNPGGTVNRTPQPIGPWWDQVNDGQWHRATQLLVLNSSSTYSHTGGTSSATETYNGTSSRDGRVALWIDGNKVMDYSQATVGVTPPGGTGVWCRQGDVDMIPGQSGSNSVGNISYVKFPDVFNGSPVAWTLDHDDLTLWKVGP